MVEPHSLFAADALFATMLGFVALAVTTEAAIGFGSVLIALTLGANLYPIPIVLPLAVCMNVMLTSYIVVRHHDHVAWRVLLTGILPAMGIGMIAGYTLFVHAPDALLRTFLGVFVIGVASFQLWQLLSPAAAALAPISPVGFATTSVAAGVVHGIAATGGPVLVYALNRLGLDKSSFRSTLACVWLVLNGTLIVAYTASNRIGSANAPYIAALLPVVAASIVLGEWLHRRLDERSFRIAVLVMLLAAGVSLLA